MYLCAAQFLQGFINFLAGKMYSNPLPTLSELGSEFKLSPYTISNSKRYPGRDAGRCSLISALLAVKLANTYLMAGIQRIKKIDFYKALWRFLDKRGCRGIQHSYLPSCHGACNFPWHVASTQEKARVSCGKQEHWQLEGTDSTSPCEPHRLPPGMLEDSQDCN